MRHGKTSYNSDHRTLIYIFIYLHIYTYMILYICLYVSINAMTRIEDNYLQLYIYNDKN